MKKLILFLIAFFFTFINVSASFAVTLPQFPSCVAPQGSVIANYPNGVHGIVGSSLSYTGSDAVYQINSEQLTQCFCPDSGTGIQTNWLKASGFSQEEIQVLKNDGWFVIPNGALWGLDEGEYLAKNSDFSCKSTGVSQGASGSSSSSGGTGGSVLGAAASIVSGFASTGNIITLYFFLTTGVFLFLAGILFKRLTK